jgi:hypothetical protein
MHKSPLNYPGVVLRAGMLHRFSFPNLPNLVLPPSEVSPGKAHATWRCGAPDQRGPSVGGGSPSYPFGCGGAQQRLPESSTTCGDLRQRQGFNLGPSRARELWWCPTASACLEGSCYSACTTRASGWRPEHGCSGPLLPSMMGIETWWILGCHVLQARRWS